MMEEKKSKKCAYCGNEFIPRNNLMRFCSTQCRRKDGLSKIVKRTCSICGDEFEVMVQSSALRCPACRGRRGVATVNIGTKKTRKCRFTPSNDNTPDGPKPEDMWQGEIPKPQMKPVTAKPKGRKLPKAPYPSAHVRERPLHVPNVKEYQIKPSRCAYTPEQDEIIRVMYDEGASWDEIGQEFGRTGDAVRRHAQIIFGGTLNRRRKNESM